MDWKVSCCILKHYTLFLTISFLFLHGFFPFSGKANPTVEVEVSKNVIKEQCTNGKRTPLVDRLVLIVIDALRLDFVTSENMPYSSKIFQENGCFISLQVHSPTVTLPRIKSLTTGSIPQFLDIMLNLIATDKVDDSLLHRLVEAQKKLVFYGDDTWLKLYPNIFSRHEGVSSFYVNDFHEVDRNVTKNVLHELERDDWDVMILHYLGLDHIGHVEGPFSKLIKPKLNEMDEIIKTIHLKSEIWNKRTLIVTTGDHGMKDSGGHGGATYTETNVPLIFSGITCSNQSAVQIDVSPTLSALLGVEIPHTALGSVIQTTLQSYDLEQILQIMNCNAHILKRNSQFNDFHDIFEQATIMYKKYLKDNHLHSGKEAMQLYETFIFLSKEKLILTSLRQNKNQLIFSVMLIILSFKNIICYFLQYKNNLLTGDFFIVVCLLAYLFLPYGYLTIIFTFITTAVLFLRNIKVTFNFQKNTNYSLIFFIFSTICHSLSLVSSSFIEEEHQFWYFFWCTMICFYIYLYFYKSLNSFVEFTVILCAFRFIRKLNQTGDKWAHLLDISQWLLYNENYLYLQAFNILGLVLTYAALYYSNVFKKTSKLLIIALIISYLLKNVWLQSQLLHKIFYLVVLLLIANFIREKQALNGFIVFWILNSTILLRPYNVILIPYCILSSFLLKKHIKLESNLAFCHYLLGNVLFFCQGHSNSLASVDIAAGYVGLASYNQFIVTLQVLFHTYTFPILCNLLALKYCQEHFYVWSINIISRLLVLTMTIIILTIQRHHLFIWTVFAPKLIIEVVHALVLLVQFCVYNLKYTNAFLKNKKSKIYTFFYFKRQYCQMVTTTKIISKFVSKILIGE